MAYQAPQSRNEAILQNILGANNVLGEPQSRIEAILQSILNDTSYTAEAMSRMEELLLAIKNSGEWNHTPISRNEEILYAKLTAGEYNKEPQSRIEELLIDWLHSSPVTYVTDIAPYLFRISGGDNNAYVGTEETDKLIGASAVVNQLVNTGTTEVPTISGHKYLTRINSVVTIQQGTGTAISINDADEDNAHDLTAMFGTAIADYVYSLEQATAGSGIAYLRKYGFFTKDYYPYTANTLQSVNTRKHTMVGKNQFNVLDYEGFVATSVTNTRTETGYISTNLASANRTVNLDLGVLPYGNYYMSFIAKKGDNTDLLIYLIKNGTNQGSSTTGFTFSSNGSDTFILRTFVLANDTNTVSNMQLQLGSTTATEYEPYSAHEYALPNIDLRGLYKLDANNNLYAVGDTLEGDGTLTRKYGIVDLGTLTYQYNAGISVFTSTNMPNMKLPPSTVARRTNIVCDVYPPSSTIAINANMDDKSMLRNDGQINIRDTSYTDPATFKTAMRGVYLIYELATPTTETVTGFTNPQTVSKDGTEEYTDERDFPLPVGHETIYPLR